MKKLIICSLAVLTICVAGSANAGPRHGNHNKPGYKHQTVQQYKFVNHRPAMHQRNSKRVTVVHNNYTKPYHHNQHNSHNKPCHASHNNGSNALAGAIVIGAITGGVLYALAK